MVYVVLGPNPEHAQRGKLADKSMTRSDADDQAAGDRGSPALFHALSYVSSLPASPLTCKKAGTLEHTAQTIANHESPRTTKLYDRTREEISMDELG